MELRVEDTNQGFIYSSRTIIRLITFQNITLYYSTLYYYINIIVYVLCVRRTDED